MGDGNNILEKFLEKIWHIVVAVIIVVGIGKAIIGAITGG